MATTYRQLAKPMSRYGLSELPSLPSDLDSMSSLEVLAAVVRRPKHAAPARRAVTMAAPAKSLDAQGALYLTGMSFGVFVGTTLGLKVCGLLGL